MALDLLHGSDDFKLPHKPSKKIQIRMGFHRLRFCLKNQSTLS